MQPNTVNEIIFLLKVTLFTVRSSLCGVWKYFQADHNCLFFKSVVLCLDHHYKSVLLLIALGSNHGDKCETSLPAACFILLWHQLCFQCENDRRQDIKKSFSGEQNKVCAISQEQDRIICMFYQMGLLVLPSWVDVTVCVCTFWLNKVSLVCQHWAECKPTGLYFWEKPEQTYQGCVLHTWWSGKQIDVSHQPRFL